VSDAPLPGHDAVALASQAAEAIRGPAHATRRPGGLGQPSAAYDVLGSLSLAAARLGQALARVTRYLDPALPVSGAGLFLDDARMSAAALAGDLDAAQQQLALVNGRPGRKDHP
jgi:hypothetical protein